MRKLTLVAALMLHTIIMTAQDIKLPKPDFNEASKSVVQALKDRHATRSFSDKELTTEQLSQLCWAAIGINRDNGRITSPTGLNKQEIRLLVFTKQGVYEYIREEHLLQCKAEGDHRELVAGTPERKQDYVLDAPVSLVMVGDLEKFGMPEEVANLIMPADAGIVCQNVNLYAEAVGLASVTRQGMNGKAIQELCGLTDKQKPLFNCAVGYEK